MKTQSLPVNLSAEPKVDPTFRRIVVVSTAIGFATVLGYEACLERAADSGFSFHWHWRALFWGALGVVGAIQLWRRLWRVYDEDTPAARASLRRLCVVILLVAAGVFLYPILFITGQQLKDLLIGLGLAAAVLTLVGWMIARTFRGFVESDAAEENQPDK